MSMTAASIDELSGGRFTLGLGVSGPNVINYWHGMSFDKPLTRTREYVEVVRAMLNRERMNHETSQLGTIKDFKISIRDIRPNIPIHIAALGPKNMELTTEIANGWIPVIMPLKNFTEEVNNIHQHLEKLGRSKNDFAITPFIPTMVGTDPQAIETLKGHMAYYFGGMGEFYNNMLARFGFEDEARLIKQRWVKNDVSGARDVISEELLDAMGPQIML